jgi:hypothetical protein
MDGISDPIAEAKFGLDSIVGDEGKSDHFPGADRDADKSNQA